VTWWGFSCSERAFTCNCFCPTTSVKVIVIPYLHNISEMKDGDSKFLVHILYRQITAAIVFAVKLLTSAKDHVFYLGFVYMSV